MTEHKPTTTVIWRISDGRPGHDSQSLGLVKAIDQLCGCVCHDIDASALQHGLISLLLSKYPPALHLPDPDLIIGAGHKTHLSLLCAKRARGGHTVVIMKPSLPLSWFDLCLIPEHDNPPAAENIFVTRGAINMISPGNQHQDDQGLILIGGPSKHYLWDNADLLEQIKTILTQTPKTNWNISNSPRTPDNTSEALMRLQHENAEFVPYQDTDSAWISEHLASVGSVWVSEDSISMIYESMTSKVATGLLRVPAKRTGRIQKNIQSLNKDNMLTTFKDWKEGKQLSPPARSLNEAVRCAQHLLTALTRKRTKH